jgi:catalase
MLSGLVNVSPRLAAEVAAGLGLEVPGAMPRAAARVPKYPIKASPSLSLTARPGDGSLRSLRVMMLIAPGLDAAPVLALRDQLRAQGAVPRLVGVRLGAVLAADGTTAVEAEATMENGPSFLYDALVLPGGAAAIKALSKVGHTAECIVNVWRHCKPILALGESGSLLEAAGVFRHLPSGDPDPGIVLEKDAEGEAAERFFEALRRRRHFERETDPPSA